MVTRRPLGEPNDATPEVPLRRRVDGDEHTPLRVAIVPDDDGSAGCFTAAKRLRERETRFATGDVETTLLSSLFPYPASKPALRAGGSLPDVLVVLFSFRPPKK